jgi:hypothetical protein
LPGALVRPSMDPPVEAPPAAQSQPGQGGPKE